MKFFISLITTLLVSFTALAEDINITADQQVEWHQKDNKMVAIGNAVASKKDMSIRADKMTAFYEKNGGKSNISKVNSIGNVIMKSGKATAYGSTMDYDLKKDEAVLKGNPAKIKTDKETITATDSITYYPSQNRAIALGDIIVSSQDGNKLYSNKLISYFSKNSKGALDIEKVEIFDNVKIITKDATVTGKRGEYFPKTGEVKLYDDVVITQNGNVLKGDIATSNLNTGISKLLAGPSSRGRVSGVFKEKEKK